MNNPLPSQLPIPQRGEARWRAVAMPNGKPVRKGPIRTRREDAQRDLENIKARISGIVWIERAEPE